MKSLTDKTIMLDLDSTLIFTSDNFELYKDLELYTNPENMNLRNRIYKFDVIDVVEKPGTGVRSSMWGILRPNVYEFLDFCFEYFENVIVWSAGQLRYVHAICDVLFIEQDKQPKIIYSYEDCERTDNFLYKPLVRLVKEVDATMSLDKVYALDDNDMTFSKNKDNALHIPPYEPELTPEGINAPDTTLLNLARWLMKEENLNNSDVRKISKDNCFNCQDHHELVVQIFSV